MALSSNISSFMAAKERLGSESEAQHQGEGDGGSRTSVPISCSPSGQSFADLPDEIIAQAFASLGNPRDVFRAGLTCRSWWHVARSPDAWKKVEVGCKFGIEAFYKEGTGAVSVPSGESLLPSVTCRTRTSSASTADGLAKTETDDLTSSSSSSSSSSSTSTEDGEGIEEEGGSTEREARRLDCLGDVESTYRRCCSFCSPFVRFLSSRGRAIQEIAVTEASAGHKDPITAREMCILLEGSPNLRNVLLYHVPSWTLEDYRACLLTVAACCRHVELLLIDSESMDSSLLLQIPSLRGLMLSNWCRPPKDDQRMCNELSRFLLLHPRLRHLVLRVESARECHLDLRSQSLISLNMSKSRNIVVRSATCPYLEEFGARGFRSEGGKRVLMDMENVVKNGCPNLKLFAR